MRTFFNTARAWGIPLLMWTILSGCGESSGLTDFGRPPSSDQDQITELPLIPLEEGYLIGASVFSSIETFLKYAEAVGPGQYDTEENFTNLYSPVQQTLEQVVTLSLEKSEIEILGQTTPENDSHSKIFSTDSTVISNLKVGVSIKSVNCTNQDANLLIENTAVQLRTFISDRFNHLTLIENRSGLESLLGKGQALLITVYGPDECWIDITTTISKHDP